VTPSRLTSANDPAVPGKTARNPRFCGCSTFYQTRSSATKSGQIPLNPVRKKANWFGTRCCTDERL